MGEREERRKGFGRVAVLSQWKKCAPGNSSCSKGPRDKEMFIDMRGMCEWMCCNILYCEDTKLADDHGQLLRSAPACVSM